MGFDSGSVSFARFAVSGQGPAAIDEALLAKLAEHTLRPAEFGRPEEQEFGWCGGRHVLDDRFSFEHNVYADCLFAALRIDINKIPSELKKAYQMMEEQAAAASNPSGFISKAQKRDVKDVVGQKIDDELRSGKHRRSKLCPVLWDVEQQTIYSPAFGTTWPKLAELMERTFGLELRQISAGAKALDILSHLGKRRDYEDLVPTRFAIGPEGESQRADYPWTAKGAEAKDFVGNEFLLWLWHEADARTGIIATGEADVSIFFDRVLEMECTFGASGKDTFMATGPTRLPEARDALRSGKAPRKAGLMVEAMGQQYSFTLQAETLNVTGLKLPEVEDADSPRAVFEQRIGLMRDVCGHIDALFATFLKRRASSAWEPQATAIRRWIAQNAQAHAA